MKDGKRGKEKPGEPDSALLGKPTVFCNAFPEGAVWTVRRPRPELNGSVDFWLNDFWLTIFLAALND